MRDKQVNDKQQEFSLKYQQIRHEFLKHNLSNNQIVLEGSVGYKFNVHKGNGSSVLIEIFRKRWWWRFDDQTHHCLWTPLKK